MNRLRLTLVVATTAGSLLTSSPGSAQVLPPVKKAERVKITKSPVLEMASEYLTIVRWETNNPGGSDVHYGVVQYGIDPKDLCQTAKNPIRLNQGHRRTTFRVRIQGLEPATTYYYRVSSEESNGTSDGAKSSLKKFTTPPRGERFVPDPKRS